MTLFRAQLLESLILFPLIKVPLANRQAGERAKDVSSVREHRQRDIKIFRSSLSHSLWETLSAIPEGRRHLHLPV